MKTEKDIYLIKMTGMIEIDQAGMKVDMIVSIKTDIVELQKGKSLLIKELKEKRLTQGKLIRSQKLQLHALNVAKRTIL